MTRPVYKPKGYYKANGRFKARSYYDAVIKSSPFTRGTQEVLVALCWGADFDQPFSKMTKPQIMEFTKAKAPIYVIRALKALREAGMIIVLSGEVGGRSVAPKYEIRPYGSKVEPEPEETSTQDDTEMTDAERLSWDKIAEFEERGEHVPDWLVRCVKDYKRKAP